MIYEIKSGVFNFYIYLKSAYRETYEINVLTDNFHLSELNT